MPIEPVNDDPIRQYSRLEKLVLTRKLLRITEGVRRVDSKSEEFSIELVCRWHQQLFNGVRDHAGRYRTADYGEDRLTFGPHRSAARADVPLELVKHVQLAKNLLDQLLALEHRLEPSLFVREIIKAALYIHAELIRIHPFRDGNGRIARLSITYFLCKFNLPPIVFEVLQHEYIDSLNLYYSTKDLEPLINLALRIYRNQLT